MKESISKQLRDFLTLDRYLTMLSFSLIVVGIVLFLFCMVLGIPINRVDTLSNPLFYLIFGLVVLVFRYFCKVTGMEVEECE